ncbi:MAG: hypothetical protein ACFFEF_05700 [Candidatus Thorarchaeota archaeon]
MDKRRKEMERLAKLYIEYLNGPFGKNVLARLKEGESFTILSKYELLRVTKEQGKAVVLVEDRIGVEGPVQEFSS